MVACPFDVPAYEYHSALHPRVRKCTFCFETRLKEGRAPACTEACPREVMTFGRREDLIKLARQKIARNPDKYVDHIYGEHEVGGTSWMYISSQPFEKIGFRTDLGTTPYPSLTRNYLSAAPLVMAIWPAFFLSIYLFTKRKDELAKQNGNDHGIRPSSRQPPGENVMPTITAAPAHRPLIAPNFVRDKIFLGMTPRDYFKSLIDSGTFHRVDHHRRRIADYVDEVHRRSGCDFQFDG
jgi:hypothetical protein